MHTQTRLDPAAFALLERVEPSRRRELRSLWNCGPCASDCERPVQALSWVLGLTWICLAAGLAGLIQPVVQPLKFLERVAAPAGDPGETLSMVEMSAPGTPSPMEQTETELLQELPPELMAVLSEPVSDVTPPLEIPDWLPVEELMEIPEAPPVDAMLTPVTPRRPASPPTPSRTSSTSSPPTPSTSRPNPATPGAAAGGGTGGAGTSASGSRKGYFPAPPYPAAARSRGMQGTVYLSITFGADGRVTSASVSRSSGYTDLDRAASDWVRRNWRGAGGQTGTFRQPVQFRLR